MRGPFSSPRRRRRVAYSSFVLLPLAGFAVLVVLRVTGGAETTATTEERIAPTIERVAQPIRVTPAIRRQLDRTIDAFLETAVVRKNLGAAWELASPGFRQGVTRREWERGELPVVPYPANAVASSSWRLVYTDERSVGVDVLVIPKKSAQAATIVYAAELTPVGSHEGRWLVDYWVPRSTLVGGPAPPTTEDGSEQTRAEAAGEPTGSSSDAALDPKWLLVPGAILALLLLTPAVLIARGLLRNRRAEQAYRAHRRG